MWCKQWSNDASKFSASMAMRIELAAQIMKQLWNCGFFFVQTASLFTLRTFGAQINWRVINRMVLFDPHSFLSNLSPIHFAGESGNGNMFLNGKQHVQNENGHRSPLMPNNCKHLNPPYFSLPTPFKSGSWWSFPLNCRLCRLHKMQSWWEGGGDSAYFSAVSIYSQG